MTSSLLFSLSKSLEHFTYISVSLSVGIFSGPPWTCSEPVSGPVWTRLCRIHRGMMAFLFIFWPNLQPLYKLHTKKNGTGRICVSWIVTKCNVRRFVHLQHPEKWNLFLCPVICRYMLPLMKTWISMENMSCCIPPDILEAWCGIWSKLVG